MSELQHVTALTKPEKHRLNLKAPTKPHIISYRLPIAICCPAAPSLSNVTTFTVDNRCALLDRVIPPGERGGGRGAERERQTDRERQRQRQREAETKEIVLRWQK